MRKKRTLATVAVLMIALPIIAAGYAGSSQQESPSQIPAGEKPSKQQVLKVDVDLVVVTATVTDPQNRYVTGLEQEHFQVFEDRVEQKIEYFNSEDVSLTAVTVSAIASLSKPAFKSKTVNFDKDKTLFIYVLYYLQIIKDNSYCIKSL